MITTKTVYRVPNLFEKSHCFLSDLLCGLWCTNTLTMEDIKQMDFYKETQYNDQCNDISGKLIDDSLKDCLFFTFLDKIHYGDDFESKYIEITWDELIAECEKVEMITCE